MPRYVELEAHVEQEELERRYRSAQDGVERSQWHILWLLSSGKRTREVGEVTGYCVDWIRKIARRYNAAGPQAIGDKRHDNPGQKRLLSAAQEAELNQEPGT